MADNPLRSLADYSSFVADLLDRPSVIRSTVVVWSDSSYTGTAEGEILFSKHNRVPAREISFGYPNLPGLVREVEGLVKA